jgi:DNA-binding transcriptional LysR family regulator
VTTAGEHIVPPLMEAFSTRHPDVTLSVEVGNRQRVFDLVRTHESDLAVGGRPPVEGVLGEPIFDNPIVIICAPGDPLARGTPSMEELGERPWLLRETGSGTRAMTEEFLAANELEPRVLTLGSNGAIKQAARAGLGISLQSRLTTQLELELGLLAAVDADCALPQRQWYLLQPKHGPVRPTVQQFLDFVRSPDGREAVERAGRPETSASSVSG